MLAVSRGGRTGGVGCGGEGESGTGDDRLPKSLLNVGGKEDWEVGSGTR